MKLGVAYLGNRFVRHFTERDLPEIVEAGCDYVVHTVSEHDLAFHSGEIAGLVAATRQAGLEAWLDCWGVGGLFAGEAFSDFLVRHPEAWRTRPDGRRQERAPAACPNAPAFRELLSSWVSAAAAAGADAVFFDDPMAPGRRMECVCEGCVEAQADYERQREPGQELWQWSIARLIAQACAEARALGLRTAVGVLPGLPEQGERVLDEQFAVARSADVVAVSPLWRAHGQPVAPYVSGSSARVVAMCRATGQEPMGWLQAFSIPAGREGEIAQAAEAMADAGIENIAAWCYGAGEQMTAIRSERPRAAWNAAAVVYRSLKARSSGG